MGLGPRVKVQGYRVILIVFEVNLYFVFFPISHYTNMTCLVPGTRVLLEDIKI